MKKLLITMGAALLCIAPLQAKKDKNRGYAEFRADDRAIIYEYYRARPHGKLPPGLEKQLRRNGRLPPGLEKKMQPFPVELESRLPPLAPGTRRCLIDDRALIYNPRSMAILDVMIVIR